MTYQLSFLIFHLTFNGFQHTPSSPNSQLTADHVFKLRINFTRA